MATRVTGSLTFSVDGPGGSTSGTVEGQGRVVSVRADDPVVAWDAALGSVSTGPELLADVAQRLYDEDLVLQVEGPRGRVATVGAGVDDRLGRLLAGSRRVHLGRPAAIRPLAVAELRRKATPRVRAAVAAVVAALVVGAVVRR